MTQKKVTQLRLEPRTPSLKGKCSTTELLSHVYNMKFTLFFIISNFYTFIFVIVSGVEPESKV